jgi:hypothetical protein
MQLPTAGRKPLFPLSSVSLPAPEKTFLPSPVHAASTNRMPTSKVSTSKTSSDKSSNKPSFCVSTKASQQQVVREQSAEQLAGQVTAQAPEDGLFAAPKVTLPVTLGSLELSFSREPSAATSDLPNNAPKPLPTEPCNHKDAAQAVGISQALLACYVSIYRSLGGRLEYSADNLRSNKYALKPRYSPALMAGFRNVRTQVRAGADIRSAMTVVMIQQASGQDPIKMMTAKASTKAATKRKRNTAKLETLASVNDSLSKEVAALQAKLDGLEPS